MKFLIKRFTHLCFIVSILLFAYTFYRSEVLWDGKANNYYFIYYIISIIILFFSFISIYFNEKIKTYLVIIFITIIFGLYLSESYIIYKGYNLTELLKEQNSIIYKNETGKEYDDRTKKEIFGDLRKLNKNIVISKPGNMFLDQKLSLLPLSGISNSQTIHCNENGYYSVYLSDRYGFNNPDKAWDQKKIEYLLVGDSFAHGDCVNRPHDIASVLRNISTKNVITLGYDGNGPLNEYASLREYLKTNVSNIILLFYEGNDLDNLTNELNSIILNKYLDDDDFSQNLKLRQNEVDKLLIEKINTVEIKKQSSFKILNFLKIHQLRSLLRVKTLQKPQHAQYQVFNIILKKINSLAASNNSNIYFVYLPSFYRYKNNYENPSYFHIKKIVNDLDIKFIDIPKILSKKSVNQLNLFPFQQRGHFTINGYKEITEIIYNFIKE